jgi:hypothetical protein
MSKHVWGIILITALFAWAMVFGLFIVLDKGETDMVKYYAYATFGVAPLVTVLGLWMFTSEQKA